MAPRTIGQARSPLHRGCKRETIGRPGRKIIERIDDSLPLDVCETKGSNAWGVDEPPAERQGQRLGRGRGMASAAGEFIDATGCPLRVGHECIDERRLADARVADEYRHSIAQVLFDLGQISAACHRDCRNVEVPVGRQKLGRVTEVHLCEDQQWVDAGVVGSDEAAIDEADARRRSATATTIPIWSTLATMMRS